MAAATLSGLCVSTLHKQPNSRVPPRSAAIAASCSVRESLKERAFNEKDCCTRRSILTGIGALTAAGLYPASFAFAEEVPDKYQAFIDARDGYSYYYPSDWRDFDFRGHDSAFKDRTLSLQNVRLSFIPTEKKDIHELGGMEEVITNLVKNVYAAPNQTPIIYAMQEKNIDGKNYWTFEYELATPRYSRAAFATISIGNGRQYTLIVGANERRWSRVRDKLKVVADSFKVLDI
ncbi:hypothetical protein QJS10_CPB20g00939 [Acorus calamus]|uniref:PsbP C-terminal domain-containing protein n=1 Tax=Acorus calamus TaxID=4465 RepID=A0AAV9CAJ0_ACOCL|nr:hypothetical protein QJS10_CPB20g00939 [Acorus calamus]